MSGWATPVLYVLAFVAVVAIVQALAAVLFSSRDRRTRVNRRLTMLESGMKPADVYAELVRRPITPNVADPRLQRLIDRFWVQVAQAGVSVSPSQLVLFVAGGGALLWLASLLILRSQPNFILNSVVSLIGAALVAIAVCLVWINGRRNARLRKLEEQLPLALDIITRAVRAGHPVVSAVQLASNEMGDPIGTEFGLIVDETTYGFEFKDALANFAKRTGSPDAHFFAVSVSIQSETGGNLAEILEGLAAVVRGRQTLALRVKALSSEGRMSAVILSALPLLTIGGIFLTAPQFYTTKFGDPIFWPVATAVGVLYLAGWLMIHRIINFKY
jgi:tight adherence protein B